MPNIKKKGYSARDLREVSDNPELTKEDFAKARPFAEALPDLAASIRRGRGPNKAPTKQLVSLRLSGKVIEVYKAKGPGWQSRIDQDLRRIMNFAMDSAQTPGSTSSARKPPIGASPSDILPP
jgi:uncharacterized protein (DUF4415 family)